MIVSVYVNGHATLDYPIDAQPLAYSVCFARHIIKKVQKRITKTILGDKWKLPMYGLILWGGGLKNLFCE